MAFAAITSFRNKQYADWLFGAQSPGQYMYGVPRYPWMYYATFVVNAQAATIWPWLRQLGSVQGVSFKIRKIDKPNVTLKQKVLNQYNRKRPVYTNTEYKPVNMTIWDTVDNKPLDMWRQYFVYYFGDSRRKSDSTMSSNPTDPVFDDATGWGLRPLTEETNFFTSLEVFAIFGLRYTQVSYLNPKIENINFNSFSNDGEGLTDITMSISYETLRYHASREITPEIAAEFGFDVGPPAVEPDVSLTGTILRSIVGISDSLLVQRNADTNSFGSIIGQAASVLANFGLAASSYNAFTRTGGGPQYGMGTVLNNPGSYTYASGVDAFDNVYASPPISGYYSNNNRGLIGQLLAGLPFGSLPLISSAIASPYVTSFRNINNPNNTTLGAFGRHNFGGGGLEVPPVVGISYSNSGNAGGPIGPYYRQGYY